jgi:catechol 2,3-dioxygenase
VAAAGEVSPGGPAIPPGTVLGHVHLRVADLQRTADFYRTELGMEVTVKSYPGALVLAWNGYHHHLGLNTWGGRTHTRPPVDARGLLGWDVRLSTGEQRTLEDPDGVRVRVAPVE